MTTTIHHPSPSPRHPRWEAIKRSFTQSNYVTDFWNWLMTLLSKAAELVLFGSVLYSGYQLLPGITHAPAGVDALVFVIQQAALDIGGMGLLKLAKRAGLPRESFPVRVGVILVVLMILNVVLASLKQAVPVIPAAVFLWIETILLVARAIMAVLFGHAIHALREEYGESTITVKDAGALREHIEELSSELSRVQRSFQQQLNQQLSRMERTFQHHLSESSVMCERTFQQQLSPLCESLHQYQEVLSHVPDMKAHLRHIESSTTEELRRVKATLENQLQNRAADPRKREERPALRALPSRQPGHNEVGTRHAKDACEVPLQATAAEKIDARTFVFACLSKNPDLKLAEIEQLAFAAGKELSQPTASRYRKQFFARCENSSVVESESSTMKGPGVDESALSSERKVIGE